MIKKKEGQRQGKEGTYAARSCLKKTQIKCKQRKRSRQRSLYENNIRLKSALFTVATLFCVTNECRDLFHKFSQIHVGLSLQTHIFLKGSVHVRVIHSKNVSPQRRGFDPRSVYVGFSVEKSASGTEFYKSILVFPLPCQYFNQHSTFIH